MHKNIKDITGLNFGNIFVIRYLETRNRRALWECRCFCGNIFTASGTDLRISKIKSCGCLKPTAKPKERKGRALKTEYYRTRLFRIWWGMKLRCYYPTKPEYKHYGAKGIKICQQWQKFAPFREWALSHGYKDNLTIDRIDVKKDYCPENCQWLTWEENHKKGIAQRDYSSWGSHHLVGTKLYYLYTARKKEMCLEWQDVAIFKKWADDHGYKEGLCLIRPDYSQPISPNNCRFGTRAEKAKIIKENKERLGIDILQPTIKEYRKIYQRKH